MASTCISQANGNLYGAHCWWLVWNIVKSIWLLFVGLGQRGTHPESTIELENREHDQCFSTQNVSCRYGCLMTAGADNTWVHVELKKRAKDSNIVRYQ